MSNLNIIDVGLRRQAWLSWSTGVLLIANMGESVAILRMLAALFSGAWFTKLATSTIRDQNPKHWPGNTINLHYTAI